MIRGSLVPVVRSLDFCLLLSQFQLCPPSHSPVVPLSVVPISAFRVSAFHPVSRITHHASRITLPHVPKLSNSGPISAFCFPNFYFSPDVPFVHKHVPRCDRSRTANVRSWRCRLKHDSGNRVKERSVAETSSQRSLREGWKQKEEMDKV